MNIVIKKCITFFALVFVVCAVGINMFVSSSSVDYGSQIRSLQAEQVQLVLAQKSLRAELAGVTSLSTVRAEAETLGYEPVKKVYAAGSVSFASR